MGRHMTHWLEGTSARLTRYLNTRRQPRHVDRTQTAALARVVCVANGKGGVSKTSVAANVAGLAAAGGFRVLLVDLDPQGDLSDDLGYYDNPNDDQGQQLAEALITGATLTANLAGIRDRLDVVSGGAWLGDATEQLAHDLKRGRPAEGILGAVLAPLASGYDLILIDTPPIDATLQTVALAAARWLLIPTRADASSIRGIRRIAERLQHTSHQLDLLGVVLTGVPTSARRIRAAAAADIQAVLGGVAPLLEATIRASDAVARTTRDRGLLVHELAEQVEGAQPYWQALRQGHSPARLPTSAPALADDYVRLTEEVLKRIAELETTTATGAA